MTRRLVIMKAEIKAFDADTEEILLLQERKREIIAQRATLKDEMKIIDEKVAAIKKGMINPFLNSKGETIFQAYTAFSAFTEKSDYLEKNFERFISSEFEPDFCNYLKPEEIETWVDNMLRRIFYTAWYGAVHAMFFSPLKLENKMEQIKCTSLEWQKFKMLVEYFSIQVDEKKNITEQVLRCRKK